MRNLMLCNFSRLKLIRSFGPTVPVRWRMNMKRKPRWLPVAPSKLYRVPEHPYVPPDEKQLMDDLLDEYYTKIASLTKLFQEEIKKNPAQSEESILEVKHKEEEKFRLLLEENAKENERIRIIREKTLEKEFQEKQLQLLQMAEEQKITMEKTKLKIENIVRLEKEKSKAYITCENIDAAVEEAIDNPVNLNFCIGLDGSITWEGKPPPEYEAEIRQRIAKGLQEM